MGGGGVFDNEVPFVASRTWKLSSLVVYLDLQSTLFGFFQQIPYSFPDPNYVALKSCIQGLLIDIQSKIHESCLMVRTQQVFLITSFEELKGLGYLKRCYSWMGIPMVPDGENFMLLRNAVEQSHGVCCVWNSLFNMGDEISTQDIADEVAAAAFVKAKLASLVVYMGLMPRVHSLQNDYVLQPMIQAFVKHMEFKMEQICLRLRGEEGVAVNSVEDLDALCYLKDKYDWKGKALVLDHGNDRGNGNGYGNDVPGNNSMLLIQAAVEKNVSYFVCRKKLN